MVYLNTCQICKRLFQLYAFIIRSIFSLRLNVLINIYEAVDVVVYCLYRGKGSNIPWVKNFQL